MKKDKLSIDKIFLFTTFIKLLLLQGIFLWGAVLIGNSNNGTYIQFPIFYSWLVLPIDYLRYFAVSPDTTTPGLIIYFFSIPIIFFLLSTITLILIWKHVINKILLIKIILFHLCGGLISIAVSKHEAWLFYPFANSIGIWFQGVTLALLGNFFFWRIFFQVLNYRSKNS